MLNNYVKIDIFAGEIRKILLLALAVGTFTLVTGCAGKGSLYQTTPTVAIRWPQESLGHSITWVKSISNFEDAGVTKGFWRQVKEFLVGRDQRRIVRPYGVLYDDRERLFIADPGSNVVHSMDIREGRYTVIGEDNSPFQSPIGLTEDEAGLLYITDSVAGVVFRYDAEKELLERFLVGKLDRPTGIVYNRSNNLLYISDTTRGVVVAYDLAGQERYRFGGSPASDIRLNRPTDLAVDKKGRIFVTEALNYHIRFYSPEGGYLGELGKAGELPGMMNKPKGIALDSEGHIYVCDSQQDAVQIFDDAGRYLLSFGSTGVEPGKFWMPSGLSIDAHDYIYVADTYNRRVQIFRYQRDPLKNSGEQPVANQAENVGVNRPPRTE